jgi:two-component system cell cycle response regulator
MKILIADDSAVSRRLLGAILERWGYEVVTASTGSEAWAILQKEENAPKLAILDWMMPGLTGPEVCTLVRQRNSRSYTYILLLTSRSEKEDLIHGMEAGADDYLVKPFDHSELKVRLGPGRRILDLHEELLKAQEALRDQATRDALTRLWNRHAIFEILERELSRARRENKPIGLVLGDLDRFKDVNDTYGHLAGDAVLREVAARMEQSVRPYDAVGRYGGEEFLLLLPGCDAEAAQHSAERMREAVEAQQVSIDGGCLDVTMSFGVTALPAGADVDLERLIKIADAALYMAKEKGRNRTEVLPFGQEDEKAANQKGRTEL